jgi:hypothetical protein
VSDGGRRAVAPLYVAAFALILAAALALGIGVVSDGGLGPALVAVVASAGGLLLLGLGVIRRSGSPPAAG